MFSYNIQLYLLSKTNVSLFTIINLSKYLALQDVDFAHFFTIKTCDIAYCLT